ncbi:sulfite exporter TauE/SafE family protein [Aggregatilinea lenta]|uniref:sulfite exporter TauE/SafE family protein n=1 Tax=Aggregatilinea lenta TaxID=913108 RepID=UPI0013C2E227|nr:sulfite exporter TauE/SafE family protein [Aggregatilinea lenta]
MILTLAVASLIIGLSKGGLGPGAGMLVTPLLSLAMPVPEAVAMALPLLLLGDFFALRLYWKQWSPYHIRLLLPFSVVGVLLGIAVLASLPDTTLRILLAVFSLVAALYKTISDRITSLTYHHHNWHAYLAGGTSGFSSAVANAGAPPFTTYMLMQKVTPVEFIGTTTLFFITVNLIKLPTLITAGFMDVESFISALLGIPLVMAGAWLGRRFIDAVQPRVFEGIMTGMLVLAAVILVAK